MKNRPNTIKCCVRVALWAVVLVVMLAPAAAAAEPADGFRSTWDLVMRWVNFIILVAVIVKFGRRPLADFISGKQDEVAYELKRLEEQKDSASDRVKEVYHQLENSRERFEQIKGRIIKQGEERKREIIDQAQNESRILFEGTRRKIDHRLQEARANLRSEMVDSAVDLALERLPQQITDEDNQKLLEKYPDLTANELRLCAFLKLNMNTKEISAVTYQSTNSIDTARSRLRQKLGIKKDDNLIAFLSQF